MFRRYRKLAVARRGAFDLASELLSMTATILEALKADGWLRQSYAGSGIEEFLHIKYLSVGRL